MRISKKILAAVLAALMAVSMMPFTAFAATTEVATAEALAAAITAANAGDTITLTADIEVASPVVIPADKDVKLNINGHSLSGNIADSDGKKLIQVSGKLEFVGNSGGCIYNTNVAGQGHAACQALSDGTVIVSAPITFGDSDEIRDNANAVNRGCGIQNNGGTLIINNGYYTAIDANYSTGAWAYAILNCEGDTTINNATVYGLGLHGALGCEEGTLTVNNGTFAVNGANNYYSLYCDGGSIIVNGGSFTDNSKNGVNYMGTNSDTEINGGTFEFSATTPFVNTGSKGDLVVSGGTFEKDGAAFTVPDKYLPEGATCENGVVNQTFVAKIGSQYYASLQNAINANSSDKIVLIADITTTSTITVPKGTSVKLDLNGHDIIGNVNGKLMTNRGTVEFVGSTGHIYNTQISAQGHDAFYNEGNVTVNAPVHFGDADDDLTNANAINRGAGLRNCGGIAVINDGFFTACDNFTNGGYAYALINDCDESETVDGVMTINDATVYGKNNGNVANNDGTVTINGGTFTLVKGSGQNGYNVYVWGDAVATVNGGTYSSTNNTAVFCVDADEDFAGAEINVNGGTFTNNGSSKIKASSKTDDYLNISGGSFSTVPAAAFCANGFTPVTVAVDGMYTVEQQDQMSISVEDSIDINIYVANNDDSIKKVRFTYNSTPDAQTSTPITETKSAASLENENGVIEINIDLAPAQIMDSIAVQPLDENDGEIGDPIETSVKAYCDAIVNGDYSTKLKDLAKSTIDYGKAASSYFKYNTSAFAGVDKQIDEVLPLPAVTEDNWYNNNLFTITGVTYRATSVPELRFYIDENSTNERALVKLNGEIECNIGDAKFVKLDDETFMLSIKNINITDFDEQIVIKYTGSDNEIFMFTPNSWVAAARNMTATDSALANLANAIGNYFVKSNAYFA